MTNAYSYLRFSTPEQSKGDSRRRQLDLARQYADAHDLELDTTLTFEDLGISAWRGANEDAALGAFKSAVTDGRVPKGSFLLVESLDRLSRQAPWAAVLQLQGILALGVTVVTLQDGKEWAPGDLQGADVMPLLSSLLVMSRAHEESETKSKRVKAAWKAKRDRAAADNGFKLTASCPAWLTLDKTAGTFRVNEQRAAVVRRIFDLYLEGLGKLKIADMFNAEGVERFGTSRVWYPSYISKILATAAVIGTFQPNVLEYDPDTRTSRKVVEGEPISGYYPAIVDPAVYHRAAELRSSKRVVQGGSGKRFSNLFAGIGVCGKCGAPMWYENKGKGRKSAAGERGAPSVWLVCSNALRKANGCTAHPWAYQETEVWTLWTALPEIDFRKVFPTVVEGARAAIKVMEDSMVTTKVGLARTKDRIEAIMDAIGDRDDSPSLRARLDKLEGEEKTLTAAVAQIEENVRRAQSDLDSAGADFSAVQDALSAWFKEQDGTDDDKVYQLRARLNQVLKRVVKEIKFHPGNAGRDGKSGRQVELCLHGPVQIMDNETGEPEESMGFTLTMS